ncbi:LPS biosynthesis-related transferase [Ktedonobacter sp. SOSP1-52]|uniref:glycosyltransferase n=1 Tax=Ktedonobacter sp. SOSP1-52 TaxID=2778366 RepID=UPI0019150346|nr:glycosyltransferase [Ktedonobacter sp. SOSP1-52]GHO70747.1 LPS biosynthesis-related transferase [Ktedonobacter sp. SOSP1-52]
MKPLNILIWHIHGSYLNTLVQMEHNWYLPIKEERTDGYGGRTPSMPAYVQEVQAEEIRNLDLDLIICQTPRNFYEDREEILSPEQQRLPTIYLEHNTPRPDATETRHLVDDPDVLLVHVTKYNRLMWNNGRTPTMVIEHSVAINPQATYTGQLARGITVINNIKERGRRLGYDLFMQARQHIPLDIAGMGTDELQGIGDIPYYDLHLRVAEYRFLFSPIRYTSLPLSVIEGMTIGLPIVALATTELPTVIENGKHGYISCDLDELVEHMQVLIAKPGLARDMGAEARKLALTRFGLKRFGDDWNAAFARVLAKNSRPTAIEQPVAPSSSSR